MTTATKPGCCVYLSQLKAYESYGISETSMFYVIIMLSTSTVLANLLFAASVLKTKLLRRRSANLLLVSNAFTDFLVGGFVLPANISWVVPICFLGKLRVICMTWQSWTEPVVFMGAAHMAAIAAERYSRVFYPRFHKAWIRTLIAPAIILCWVLPVIVTIVPYYFPPVHLYLDPPGSVSSDNVTMTCAMGCPQFRFVTGWFPVAMGLLQMLIPVLMAFYCYGRIMILGLFRVRKADQLRVHLQPNQNQLSGTSVYFLLRFHSGAEFQAIRIFLIVLLAFAVLWVPHTVLKIRRAFEMDSYVLSMAYHVALWNSLVNPLLLFLFNRNYRRGSKNLFSGMFLLFKTDKLTGPSTIDLQSNKLNEMAQMLETN